MVIAEESRKRKTIFIVIFISPSVFPFWDATGKKSIKEFHFEKFTIETIIMAFLPMSVKKVLQQDYCWNQIPIEEMYSSNATEGIKSPDKQYVLNRILPNKKCAQHLPRKVSRKIELYTDYKQLPWIQWHRLHQSWKSPRLFKKKGEQHIDFCLSLAIYLIFTCKNLQLLFFLNYKVLCFLECFNLFCQKK